MSTLNQRSEEVVRSLVEDATGDGRPWIPYELVVQTARREQSMRRPEVERAVERLCERGELRKRSADYLQPAGRPGDN